MIAASECVVKTTWKNLASAFEDLLQYMKYMEEACHGSIKKIGEQWGECQNSGVETGNYVDLYRESGDD